MPMTETNGPTIVERAAGRLGELALRAVGEHYEIISNGVFLMDTRNGCRSGCSRGWRCATRPSRSRLLIGGLGVGFSLAEALRSDRLERVTVVEIEPKIVEWNRTCLAPFSGHALSDPRVEVVEDDLARWLRRNEEVVRRNLPGRRQRPGCGRSPTPTRRSIRTRASP